MASFAFFKGNLKEKDVRCCAEESELTLYLSMCAKQGNSSQRASRNKRHSHPSIFISPDLAAHTVCHEDD